MENIKYTNPKSCQIKNLAELYDKYFGNKPNGFFVDVGAYDGYEWSNTWALSEVGWEGLCIEPYPPYAEKCKNKHNSSKHTVTTLQCAAGDFNGPCNMFLDHTGPSHSIDEKTTILSPWGFQYSGDKLEVECFTLNFILENMYVATKSIDVLSIDVEGAELKVLDGFSLKKYKPFMIIIETHKGQSGKDYNYDELHNLLTYFGYTELQSDGLNSIYIYK